MVKYNNYLNDFNINGLREAHKGKVKFYVTMELDKNGILKINVNEINHSKSMLIKCVNDLSSEQIKWFKEQELISKMMTNYINKKLKPKKKYLILYMNEKGNQKIIKIQKI